MYTMAGSLCALYAHNRPYAARARTLAWVVLGMLGGVAVALVTASLTRNAVVLVTVGALLAAVQKALCDASRSARRATWSSPSSASPPSSSRRPSARSPVTWRWPPPPASGPGSSAWHPPRSARTARNAGATAQALNAAAAYAASHRTGEDRAPARAAGCAAGDRPPGRRCWPCRPRAPAPPPRHALERLVVRAEVALAAPADTDPERLRAWAHALRGGGRIPRTGDAPGDRDELLGVDAELAARPAPLWQRLRPAGPDRRAHRPRLRAGRVRLPGPRHRPPLLGPGHRRRALPGQPDPDLDRAVQRVVGNLAGVLLFAAIAPLAHLGQALLVAVRRARPRLRRRGLVSGDYWRRPRLV
ncbi:hypothetical protein STENM327S_08952 [Streptomyces tendae]